MSAVHEILFEGGAQTIVHVPIARVSSATVEIVDVNVGEGSTEREILALGAATVDGLNLTTAADAGPEELSPFEIAVSSSAGATVGTTYAIIGADGQYELFRCAGVSAGLLVAGAALSARYESGASVRGVQLSATFPLAAAANEQLYREDRPLRAIWRYTIGGQGVASHEQIRVVAQRYSQQYLTSAEAELRSCWADVVKELSPRANALRDIISAAAEDVEVKLLKRQIDAGQLLSSKHGHKAVVAAALLLIAKSGSAPQTLSPQEFLDVMKEDYVGVLHDLSRGLAPRGEVEVERESDQATAIHSRRYRAVTVRS